MANSSSLAAARKPAKLDPNWRIQWGLHPQFPLFPHQRGRWAKKVRGQLRYFGKVSDGPKGQAALGLWIEQKDDLIAGRAPESNVAGLPSATFAMSSLQRSAETIVWLVRPTIYQEDGPIRRAVEIVLADDDRQTLNKWARGRSTPARLVLRAKIALAAADGKLSCNIAAELCDRKVHAAPSASGVDQVSDTHRRLDRPDEGPAFDHR